MKIMAKEINHHFVTKNSTIVCKHDDKELYLFGNESNCLFTSEPKPGVTPLTFYFSEAKRIAEALSALDHMPSPRDCSRIINITL